MTPLVSSPLVNRPSPRSNSSTPTASTPTPSNPVPSNSSPHHALPSPSSNSSSSSSSSSTSASLLSPTAPSIIPAPHHFSPAAVHLQLSSTPYKPPSSRRRMSTPSIQLAPQAPQPLSTQLVVDDIVIGGECGAVNGGTALGPHQPMPNENWIAHHLTIVLQHSFTVSSPHPITSQPSPADAPTHCLQPDHPIKNGFLTFRDSLSPEHLRNKFSITSLSSFTTSTTTDEDEDDETDEVEEIESQDSTASSCYFPKLNPRATLHSQPPFGLLGSDSCTPSQPPAYSGPSSPTHQPRSISPPQSHFPLQSSVASAQSITSRTHLLGILNTWSFDANSLSPLQIRCSLHILLSVYLKYTPGFTQKLEDLGVVAPEECLRGLVDNLEVAYDARNAYHNFRHAVDVVQAVYTILSYEGIVPPLGWVLQKESGAECQLSWQRQPVGRLGRLLDDMTIWALLLAAAGHDVGHPGLSNAFMVNARTPIAHVFSDGAVLENFHRITFTRMLREHGFEKMVDGHAGFRQVLVGAVLSTDMGRHFPIVEQLKRLVADWSKSPENDCATAMDELAQKVLITAGLIKCGDISNSSRPHHISLTWSSCLLTEWSRQAALEADLHLPVSVVTLDPAEKRAQAKSQIGFTSLFVLPLFTVMEQLSPKAFRPFADNCRLGLTTWQKVVEQIDSSGANLVSDATLNSTSPQRPLPIDSTPSQQRVDDNVPDAMTRGLCPVDLNLSPLSGRPCDSLPSISLFQAQTSPACVTENHSSKLTNAGWWAGPSSCPTNDDFNPEDSNLSSISSSSVSTLRDPSHVTNPNESRPYPELISDLVPSQVPPNLDQPKILPPSNDELPRSHRSFNFNVVLSHPDRHSNASFSSDEGKANSSNDDSSFSSLGSPSSPPRSPFFSAEVYSACSTGSSNDGGGSRVLLKEVQFDPSTPQPSSVHYLRSPQRPRDKGMSVDAGLVHRNLTRTSFPHRKKSYSPHLVNQQVACAKGCGKVTVKCVKCATESKIKMYRSLSLARPSLFCDPVLSGPRSPSGSHVPEHSRFPSEPNPIRATPPGRINLFTLSKLTEEKPLTSSPNSAAFSNQQLAWPPHPFRPLC